MLKKSVGGVFMPHGLGHLLGLVCLYLFDLALGTYVTESDHSPRPCLPASMSTTSEATPPESTGSTNPAYDTSACDGSWSRGWSSPSSQGSTLSTPF